jgi:hypothetical protein
VGAFCDDGSCCTAGDQERHLSKHGSFFHGAGRRGEKDKRKTEGARRRLGRW